MQCEGLLPASLLVRAALVWYSAAVKAAANLRSGGAPNAEAAE